MGNLLKAFGKSFANSLKTSQEKARKEYLLNKGKMCPRCEGENINTVKAKSWLTSALRGRYFQELYNRSKDLYACKDCGFGWEAR